MSRKNVEPRHKWWAKGLIHCYVCGLDLTGLGLIARKFYSQQTPGVVAYAHSTAGLSVTVDSCEAVLIDSDEWDTEHPDDKTQREAEKVLMKGSTYYEERE